MTGNLLTGSNRIIKTAVTIGKFDGFHYGHQLLIDRLLHFKQNGMRAVAVMIDFGKPGILTEEESREFCEKAGLDELIRIPFTDELRTMNPEEFFKKVLLEKFSIGAIVVGTDFRFGFERKGSIEDLKSFSSKYGFEFEAVEKRKIDGEVVSSTRVREALSSGDVKTAKNLLGMPYFVKGPILHGKHLGSTIGFPTLNLIPSKDKLLPKFGVYKTECVFDENTGNEMHFTGLTNVGVRPTIEDGDQVTVETFVLDFDQDVYGKVVKVAFKEFIRPEMKFDSLDMLIGQMKTDLQSCK